jgi:hypothetical protein
MLPIKNYLSILIWLEIQPSWDQNLGFWPWFQLGFDSTPKCIPLKHTASLDVEIVEIGPDVEVARYEKKRGQEKTNKVDRYSSPIRQAGPTNPVSMETGALGVNLIIIN